MAYFGRKMEATPVVGNEYATPTHWDAFMMGATSLHCSHVNHTRGLAYFVPYNRWGRMGARKTRIIATLAECKRAAEIL